MKANILIGARMYSVDLALPIDISIPLVDHPDQVKCFHAPDVKFTPVISGNFIGAIEQGSPVNFYNIAVNPHGNATHTECAGHIFNNGLTLNKIPHVAHQIAQLISVNIADKPCISEKDLAQLTIDPHVTALIIRTLPNPCTKLTTDYSGSSPCYLDISAISLINSIGIEHLLVDIPSVDPEEDGGALSAHKAFWANDAQFHKTITELIFVPEDLIDGLYLLNLQYLNIALDASPSRPLLFKIHA